MGSGRVRIDRALLSAVLGETHISKLSTTNISTSKDNAIMLWPKALKEATLSMFPYK
jgi:hypothetical protein